MCRNGRISMTINSGICSKSASFGGKIRFKRFHSRSTRTCVANHRANCSFLDTGSRLDMVD
jgi:hypothetical protein